jgi:hypothetical protein
MYDLMVKDAEFGWITVDGFETDAQAQRALVEEVLLTGNNPSNYRILYVG